MDFLVNLNLNKNEIQNAVIQPLAVAPQNAVKGQIYFNSGDNFIYRYDGTKWKPVGVLYSQDSSTGAVITGLDESGNVTTTKTIELTLDGLTPVESGYITNGMTLEAALKALDTAVKDAVAGGGEVNQNAFSVVNVSKQSTVATDVVGSATDVKINATAKTDTVSIGSGNKWVQVKGDSANKTVTIGHKTSDVEAGQYGSNSKVAQITVDEAGHITNATEQTITPASIGADPAGSASNVLGTETDDSTKATVYGAKKAASEALTAAQNAQSSANDKVASVGEGNKGVIIGGTATNPTVGINLSKGVGNAATIASDGLMVTIPAGDTYSMVKADAPSNDAFATYHLTKNGENVGTPIDIPKDYLVKDAQLKTATGDDASGFPAGTEYIDFTINAKDGQGSESHIYLNVASLAVVYSAGDGITIDDSNKISVKIVASNGLSVDTDGIKLAVATTTTGGAMSSADKTKLNGIDTGATNNTITLNGTAVKNPSFYAPTDSGTDGQILTSAGANKPPVWKPMHEVVHKYTAVNGALTATGGSFTWTIDSSVHGIQNSAILVNLYEVASNEMVLADVVVNPTNYAITIRINDTSSAGTLEASKYRVVAIG